MTELENLILVIEKKIKDIINGECDKKFLEKLIEQLEGIHKIDDNTFINISKNYINTIIDTFCNK